MTLAGTWAFVAAYIVLPIGLTLLLAHQLRQPGGEPPRYSRLPTWARATIVVLLVVGALLLAIPATTRGVWPWTLTPLMGRANWGTPQSWIFVAFLASMILFAFAGYLETRRALTPQGASTRSNERVF